MRFSHKLFPIIVFSFVGAAHAVGDFESARNTVLSRLSQEEPTCLKEFDSFFKRYDALVVSFFDKKNNDPLETHIEHMEKELQTLKNVCEDARYRCVNPILCNYRTHITELITLLKDYIGSHDALSLAFKVRKFKTILPEAVKQRGDISLFWSLYHRLRCE